MSTLFGNFIFLNPWILAGLAGLPLLWFLLRITPPAPKRILLPTTRFLAGLIPEHQTPSHTPWWILLLRMIIAALVLLALAQPVYNPAGQLPGTNAIRLLIDNSWASAQNWDEQIQAAEEIMTQAGREEREIYIQTTASLPGTDKPTNFGPMSEGQAMSVIKGLSPLPWPADYQDLASRLDKNRLDQIVHSIWLSHGLDEDGFKDLAYVLLSQGGLTYISPTKERLPLLLKPQKNSSYESGISVIAPTSVPTNLPVSIQAVAEDGRILDQQTIALKADGLPTPVSFDIPEALKGDVSKYKLSGHEGTGGVYLLDERYKKRAIGIVGVSDDSDTKPFIEARYYLKRALEPFSSLHTGSIENLLKQDLSMIILPDIGAMPAGTLNMLEDWVRKGGLLLRFAGPNMADQNTIGGKNFLTPVPLRANIRATEGSLSWEDSPKLTEFPEKSPLYGIRIYEDIVVRSQILAEPSDELEQKTWATLDDGTPIITADSLDQGLLVMIHTSASAAWSDLALSGTYVEILQRLASISGRTQKQTTTANGFLQPLWVFDGFGQVQSPDGSAEPISAAKFSETMPGSTHPPGFYSNSSDQKALNIGDHIDAIKIPTNIPLGVNQQVYGTEYERDLMPLVLYLALALLLADWLLMSLITMGLKPLIRHASVVFIFAALPAHASDDLKYSEGLYLAFVQTGNASVDATSYKGLENLSDVLRRRTSAEPDGVASLNIERDSLVFFPLIYWPITENMQSLSESALKKIQHYLDHGGTILFDTRDQNYAASALRGTKNSQNLRQMIGGLNIPPLEPINKEHVLGKSFYLLGSFPGHYTGGSLWVEKNSLNGRDGVSSVLIGSHDWAKAWAAGRSQRLSLSGGSRQQEMSFRFGVNVVMYALTGNYKADQVHVPHILERLGQ